MLIQKNSWDPNVAIYTAKIAIIILLHIAWILQHCILITTNASAQSLITRFSNNFHRYGWYIACMSVSVALPKFSPLKRNMTTSRYANLFVYASMWVFAVDSFKLGIAENGVRNSDERSQHRTDNNIIIILIALTVRVLPFQHNNRFHNFSSWYHIFCLWSRVNDCYYYVLRVTVLIADTKYSSWGLVSENVIDNQKFYVNFANSELLFCTTCTAKTQIFYRILMEKFRLFNIWMHCYAWMQRRNA